MFKNLVRSTLDARSMHAFNIDICNDDDSPVSLFFLFSVLFKIISCFN